MKSAKKITSVMLSTLMLVTSASASISVNASTGTLCDKYATNPQGKVGAQKTITIDGSFSDWSSDMLIAQGAAWDVANHYKGGHENCVLDTYALYGAWDNDNLYVAWQMVNTTDTWARSGDGPLSDGGRVLDVPLILALDIDPSSVSMSNKNTNGGPIWGNKMGLEFNQHVDRLLYMSGKPGLGEPGMFSAVDAQGNTNYTNGLKTFKSNGIEYKMAEGNICDSIIGLNYSEDPDDVYSSDADWVDYKTFKGSSGAHDTKYDSFYEIKIPLSTLGIDANYIENYGIGAMLVATRGESGLDCIPFDDTMLDNATGSYASDPSTSHEKDDVDVITSSFAKIGNLGGVVPPTQPTTARPTEAPTTVKPTDAPTTTPTTAPATTAVPTAVAPDTLNVKATSNIFETKSVEASKSTKTVTVSYDLKSSMNLVNGQWTLSYDNTKLKLVNTDSSIMPYISDCVVKDQNGVAKGNFSNATNLYDFTSSKPFVQATFEIIGTGNTEVKLDVEEMSVGYLSNGSLNYKNAVVNSTVQNLSGVPGFSSSSISGTTAVNTDVQPTTVQPTTVQPTTAQPTTAAPTTAPVTTQPATTAPITEPSTAPTTAPVADTLTVNASSNILSPASKVYNNNENTVTVSYKLQSTMKLINAQWSLTYDNTKLSFDPAKNVDSIMPNTSNFEYSAKFANKINGSCSSPNLFNFTKEKDFVNVTFDIIGRGEANINLDIQILGVAYKNQNQETITAYPVDNSKLQDVTGIAGFENQKLSGRITFGEEDILYGDVNRDGKIDIKDVTTIQKHLASDSGLDDDQKKRADVNFDGKIDIKDATTIQKYLAGIISSFK